MPGDEESTRAQSPDGAELNDSNDHVFMSKAVQVTRERLDQEMDTKNSGNQAEATNRSIETVAALHPHADEKLVANFIRGKNRRHFVDSDWPSYPKPNMNGDNCEQDCQSSSKVDNDQGCPDCQKAVFDVCVNVASALFDLFNVPFAVARKGATVLINAMPWDAKVRLANIASEYFTEPGNIPKIAKGVNIISEMLIDTFGDIGTLISIAFHDLSKKDYAIIAANIAVSVSLLFASGGTALLIRLGLKTKTIYGITMSVIKLKKERNKHRPARKRKDRESAMDWTEKAIRRPFVQLKSVKDKVISVIEESDISIKKTSSPTKDEVKSESGDKE